MTGSGTSTCWILLMKHWNHKGREGKCLIIKTSRHHPHPWRYDLCLILLTFIGAVHQHPYHSLNHLHPLPPALMPALGKECEKMKQMKKRRRCNECRLIARFPLDDTTSINALDAMLRARVQIQISQRTQVSSTPIFAQNIRSQSSCLGKATAASWRLWGARTIAPVLSPPGATLAPPVTTRVDGPLALAALARTIAAVPSPGAAPHPPNQLGRLSAPAAPGSTTPGTHTAAVTAEVLPGRSLMADQNVVGKETPSNNKSIISFSSPKWQGSFLPAQLILAQFIYILFQWNMYVQIRE